jgi:hypothetical protein
MPSFRTIPRRRFSYALFGLLALFGSCAARAEQADVFQSPGQQVAYDIPSQSLGGALDVYAAASGAQVLYETSLTAGRTSAPVQGTFTPEAALRILLTDTGLTARRTDVDAITILREPREAAEAPAIVPDARFLGALQAGILDALCRGGETRPGNYRMALQLWIGPAGGIQRASLLSSTGDEARDAALTSLLQKVSTGARPPPGLKQPVTLAIVPRSPLQQSECAPR